MILAGDIGGTNTRLALFEGSADRLTAVATEVFPSPAHRGPEEILRKFGHLALTQVHAALAYYHANQVEIDADLEAEVQETEADVIRSKIITRLVNVGRFEVKYGIYTAEVLN